MLKSLICGAIVITLLGGCAIHPLPEDVTGVTTPEIVRQIRCETREAIRGVIIKWLTNFAGHGDPVAADLLAEYTANPEAINTFSPDSFKGQEYAQVRSVIKLFYETGIGYNFDLTMSEDNDLSTELDFLRLLPQPKFTLVFNAGANRRRTNERTFTVTDTFKYLLATLNTPVRGVRYCDYRVVGPNYIYPIVGRIGVDRLVQDFIELTLFGHLAGSEKAVALPTMSDKLTFTTKLNASATPTIEFTPIQRPFRLTKGTLTAGVVRQDVHQVTVALAIATSGMKELSGFRTFLFSAARGTAGAAPRGVGRGVALQDTIFVGDRVTGGGTPSEVLAVIAIDQLKRREFEFVYGP